MLARSKPNCFYGGNKGESPEVESFEVFGLLADDDGMGEGGGNLVSLLASEEDDDTVHLAFDTGDIVTFAWSGEAAKVTHGSP